MNDIEQVRIAQHAKADTIREKFYDKHRQDVLHWGLERADERFLHQLTSSCMTDRLLLCNRGVRKHAAYAWVDALLNEYTQYPDRERVWVTIAWDKPVTWERSPNIDTVSWRNIASQHLRRCGLEGIGTLEIDTWKEIIGEPGKRISPHIHFLGHAPNGEKIAAKKLARELRGRAALSNSLGAHSVVVKPVGARAEDLATLGFYMSKPPAYAKNPIPRPAGRGYELVQVNHASGSVTRLIEVLSYLELGDVMFSIGSGKHISRRIRDHVKERCARTRRAELAPARDTIERHWRRIRMTNGNRKFAPCNVITRAAQRTAGLQDD